MNYLYLLKAAQLFCTSHSFQFLRGSVPNVACHQQTETWSAALTWYKEPGKSDPIETTEGGWTRLGDFPSPPSLKTPPLSAIPLQNQTPRWQCHRKRSSDFGTGGRGCECTWRGTWPAKCARWIRKKARATRSIFRG